MNNDTPSISVVETKRQPPTYFEFYAHPHAEYKIFWDFEDTYGDWVYLYNGDIYEILIESEGGSNTTQFSIPDTAFTENGMATCLVATFNYTSDAIESIESLTPIINDKDIYKEYMLIQGTLQ